MRAPPITPPEVFDTWTGRYLLEGAGELTLTRRGAFLHVSGVRTGLAMLWEKRLVIAFGPLNQVEIGAYRVTPKLVTGLWVPPGADQPDYTACGIEESLPGTDGAWRITTAVAIDKSTYAGKITRDLMHGTDPAAVPQAVHMHWRLEDGEYRSFGLDYGNALYSTFCLLPEEPHGLAVYEGKPSKSPTLTGTAILSQGRGPQPETLTRL